ncbi:UNVERIFIED_CONTAM: hypothetical protein Sradi_0191700 [Sesamum radiatum]|uniref:Uncharacterized protein n=1 Tax=Sesamum radiatum TaxID=300843 RepID=A0AAW2W0G6_SESRA
MTGEIRGIAVARNTPRVSHLLFIDDTLIYCQASTEAMRSIRDILHYYGQASRQRINFDKSSILFSRNCPWEKQDELARVLGVRVDISPTRYLGLPSLVGRNKRDIFSGVHERVWQLVGGLKEKLLSQGGKDILIKSIIQAIPSHCMSVFKLPTSLVKEIDSISANFFWNDSTKNKIHWVAWDKICRGKKEGGMCFRNLQSFQLLGKQGWRILNQSGLLLSRILRARYFPSGDLLGAKKSVEHVLYMEKYS